MVDFKKGHLSIGLVCFVFGIMLAVQFRSTKEMHSSIPYQRLEDLTQRLGQTERERDSLVKEVHKLRDEIGKGILTPEMQLIKIGAGVVAVKGPGIILTIDDSKRATKPGDNPNLYLIHDDDVLRVINELRAAGSEAISINEQRLIATSEIRCAGPTLSVNNTRYSPPYKIMAIGDPQTLENALKMRGGVIETLQFWGIQLTIKSQEKLIVPAYKGAFKFDYAKPVKEGEKD